MQRKIGIVSPNLRSRIKPLGLTVFLSVMLALSFFADCNFLDAIYFHPPWRQGCWKVVPCECLLGYEKRWKFATDLEEEKKFPLIKAEAEAGDVTAQRKLAYVYSHHAAEEYGESCLNRHCDREKQIENLKRAAEWFRKAAKKNDPISQFELAALYSGLISPADYESAYFWAASSAESDSNVKERASDLRDEAARHLSASQISDINKRLKSKSWQ